MHRLILATITPDNTPHGYNWSFAFPMLLVVVIAAVLYALLSRPHRRVPGRPISAISAAAAPRTGAHITASQAPASDKPAGDAPATPAEPAEPATPAEPDAPDGPEASE